MQKQIKIFSTLLTVLVLAVSCANTNPNDPTKTKEELLKQKWQDNDTTYGISQYHITDNKFDSLYNNSVSYSITIEKIAWNTDNTSGIIYGKYTVNNNNPNYVGKYYAISFKGLADSKVSISGASKNIGTTEKPTYDSSAESLEEAKTKFTEANGYFDFYSDCTAVE
ncbi:hypothetical protein R4K52_10390 [Brachyspira pilosicoli]|mgnify:FL=1|uniref:hypothetical protein n=1 Tax=Brachyspira pilosicoli TaxID=52584 RepID=UPI0024939317|nr:hypothetical protein [Brachyspira pilosicoli]WIH90302.1 hypothetical protein NEI02_11430 [Brachyspira pilosicoli]WIH92593.1 hypothetical protein NEI01_11405 [Brachyspira pilosicoli]